MKIIIHKWTKEGYDDGEPLHRDLQGVTSSCSYEYSGALRVHRIDSVRPTVLGDICVYVEMEGPQPETSVEQPVAVEEMPQ